MNHTQVCICLSVYIVLVGIIHMFVAYYVSYISQAQPAVRGVRQQKQCINLIALRAFGAAAPSGGFSAYLKSRTTSNPHPIVNIMSWLSASILPLFFYRIV
jgi:hypothetical protein